MTTTNATHTPGPWKVVPVGVRTHWSDIVGSDGQIVAQAMNIHGAMRELANARLIAAAPDLLDACKGMLLQIDPCPDGVPMSARCKVCGNHPTKHNPDCVVLVARAAIARAEGGGR